jgi:ABC-type multidrug transport system ATPase subunit
MNKIIFKITNYKNIQPFEFSIELNKTTIILGPNLAGKTNVLKFIEEFNDIFNKIKNDKELFNKENFQINLSMGISFDRVANFDFLRNPIIFEMIDPKTEQYLKLTIAGDVDNKNNYLCSVLVEKSLLLDEHTIEFFKEVAKCFSNNIYINSDEPLDENIWRHWCDNIDKEKKLDNLSDELNKIFNPNNFEIILTTPIKIKINNKKHFINDISGGVKRTLQILGKIMMRKEGEPELIMIDEPEKGLNRTILKKLMDGISSKNKTVIVTSHSNEFSKDNNFLVIRNGLIEKYDELIDLSSIHQQERIIIVEGKTDKYILNEWLKKYEKEKYYDIHSFGGNGFARRTNKDEIKSFLGMFLREPVKSLLIIFDRDENGKNNELHPKFNTFLEVCNTYPKVKVFPTEYHSIENYFSEEAVEKVYGKKFIIPKTGEKISNFGDENKLKGYLVIQEMTKDELENNGLGQFLLKDISEIEN